MILFQIHPVACSRVHPRLARFTKTKCGISKNGRFRRNSFSRSGCSKSRSHIGIGKIGYSTITFSCCRTGIASRSMSHSRTLLGIR